MDGPITFGMDKYLNYVNLQPSEVKGRCNAAVEIWKRYLYNNIFSCYDFTLPDSWALNFFRFWLFYYGSIGCIYTSELGWIIYPYGVSKLDYQYQPSEIIIYNQFLNKSKTGVIGVNAGIIRIMDDFFGLDDLVTHYAEMLAQIDRSINVNLMNSNVAMVIEADGKKQADSIKEAYAEATTGKPMVAMNKELLNGESLHPLLGNIKSNYIVTDLLTARRTLKNEFLTEIGILNRNFEKRAQVTDDEVHQTDGETESIIHVILKNLKKCFSEINAISGLGLDVKPHFDYGMRREGEGNGNSMVQRQNGN